MPPPPQQPQPNPYGQQPAPYGQQPTPYGQQQPAPYGQQPYPGAPYGQQPQTPWGAPPMGFPMAPPPKKSRKGLIFGIVGGVAVLVVGVVVALALIGQKVVGGFPEAEYELTLPKTLLDGKYQLTKDQSSTVGADVENEVDDVRDAKDPHGVAAQYGVGGVDAKGVLSVTGMYGRFKNTGEGRRSLMKGAAKGAGAVVAVQPKDFRPAGSDIPIACEVLTKTQSGARTTMPICSWMDGNTSATVAEISQESVRQDPADVDLDAAAAATAKVRAEMRKPLG
ncbi:hypothetical protein [Streptomyces sp. NPDC050738]|uniref:hypothetical protein n=1 Tax=Streptomyces sp. NPDC050738 TaxID=3154744 RepID=UPI00342C45BC